MGTLHTLAQVAGEFVRSTAAPGQTVTLELSPVQGGNRARGAARYSVALLAPWLTAHKLRFVTSRGYLATYQYRDLATWAAKNLPGVACGFTIALPDASTLPAKWTPGRVAAQARRIADINGQALKDGAMQKAQSVADWAASQRKTDAMAAARAMSEAAALLDVLLLGAPWPEPGTAEPPVTPGNGDGGGGDGGGDGEAPSGAAPVGVVLDDAWSGGNRASIAGRHPELMRPGLTATWAGAGAIEAGYLVAKPGQAWGDATLSIAGTPEPGGASLTLLWDWPGYATGEDIYPIDITFAGTRVQVQRVNMAWNLIVNNTNWVPLELNDTTRAGAGGAPEPVGGAVYAIQIGTDTGATVRAFGLEWAGPAGAGGVFDGVQLSVAYGMGRLGRVRIENPAALRSEADAGTVMPGAGAGDGGGGGAGDGGGDVLGVRGEDGKYPAGSLIMKDTFTQNPGMLDARAIEQTVKAGDAWIGSPKAHVSLGLWGDQGESFTAQTGHGIAEYVTNGGYRVDFEFMAGSKPIVAWQYPLCIFIGDGLRTGFVINDVGAGPFLKFGDAENPISYSADEAYSGYMTVTDGLQTLQFMGQTMTTSNQCQYVDDDGESVDLGPLDAGAIYVSMDGTHQLLLLKVTAI